MMLGLGGAEPLVEYRAGGGEQYKQSVLLAILRMNILNMRKRHLACHTYRRWWGIYPPF